MAGLIAKYDWAKTRLGAIADWPPSLRTTVNIMLQSPVPIVTLWGKDGIMIYNDAYADFAGVKHPQLLGSKVVEGWPEIAEFNRNVLMAGLKGQTFSYKDQKLTLHRNNKPEQVWMDLSYSPVYDENNKPWGVFAIIIETTDRVCAEQKRKQAKGALKIEQEQLRVLLSQAPAAIAVVEGEKHRFVLANDCYQQVFGRTGKELLGKTVREVFPEIEGQGVYEIFDEVYATGKPFTASEYPVMFDRQGNGTQEPGYFSFVAQPIKDNAGKITSLLIHAIETTDQVEARQKIEDSEERFRFMAETLPQLIFTATPEGKVDYYSPQWGEYTGIPMSTLTPQDVRSHIHPDDLPGNMQSWRRAIRTKMPMQSEQRLRRADGQYRRHISYVRPMLNEADEVVRWFGSMTDIEDSSQTAARNVALEKAKAFLEEQRTQLLTINKAKDEFISLASHQLRTPATGVKQYVGMVLEGYAGEITPDQKLFLERANESNERQLKIVNDLLKVANVDAGKVELHMDRVDLVSLIKDVVADQHIQFAAKQQTVSFLHKTKELCAAADHQLLRMVLENLLDNASKYSYPHTEITITLTQSRATGPFIRIADQGVGIAAVDVDRLFKKFTRINNPLSLEVDGSGLGLYWVKKVVDLHGGSIGIDSAKGKGTTFMLSLPAPPES